MSRNTKKTSVPIPKDDDFCGKQLDLFQSFLCNEDNKDQLSNTIDLWDSVPRYSISQRSINKMRTKEGLLPRLEHTFKHKGSLYIAKITAAIIDDGSAGDKAYYPSANEELIEDSLRKIATEQHIGFFDKPNYSSGAVFSLYILRRELKKRGHTRSYQEIVKSLKILAGSHIELSDANGKSFAESNYFPSMAAVTLEHFKTHRDAQWVVHFHPLVTRSIDVLTYRQFNYHQMMSHRSQLARWIHKQLAIKYTFASYLKPFDMQYKTIKRDSCLLSYGRERANIEALDSAFDELQTNDVIHNFDKRVIEGRRGKIENVTYTLHPTTSFVSEMKAANKRLSHAVDNQDKQ